MSSPLLSAGDFDLDKLGAFLMSDRAPKDCMQLSDLDGFLAGIAIGPKRKVIIAPDGGDAWAPAKPRPDSTLIRALARAHRWKRMLEEGTCRSAGEIAEAECITRSFVNRLLRLTLLTPDLQEAILDGRQPKGLQLAVLTGKLPSAWHEQRQHLPTTFARSAGPRTSTSRVEPRCARQSPADAGL